MNATNGHNQNGHNPTDSQHLLTDEAPRQEPESIESVVRRMLLQCRALLRQELERKAQREPLLYDASRISQVLWRFERASDDIQLAVLERIRGRLRTHVQQELAHVLEDAVHDGFNSLENPLRQFQKANEPPISRESPSPYEGSRPDGAKADALAGASEALDGAFDDVQSRPREQRPVVLSLIKGDQRQRPPAPLEEAPAAPATQKQQVAPAQSEAPTPAASAKPPSGETFQGTVELHVDTNQSIQRIIRFVDELRRCAEFRVMQIVGDHLHGIDIWVMLRSPIALRGVLLNISGVEEVQVQDGPNSAGAGPRVKVRLAETASPA